MERLRNAASPGQIAVDTGDEPKAWDEGRCSNRSSASPANGSVVGGKMAMVARLTGYAVALLTALGGAAAAGTGDRILNELALDGISAGTATSMAEAFGVASSSELATVEVNGDTTSSTDGKISVSSSTVVATAFALGPGAITQTGGAASADGNAGRIAKVMTVRAVTPYGKSSATVAHATAVGLVP